MATEIERKFIVTDEGWRKHVVRSRRFRQGYLALEKRMSIRVRISDDDQGVLTIKSAASGLSRQEFEYQVPVADAEAMLAMTCGSLIEKVRHDVRVGRHVWEVDVFAGENAGLVIAELELAAEDEQVSLPAWIGPEVTLDPRYLNASLARNPFCRWRGQDRPHE